MLMQQKCYTCLFRQAVDAAWLLTDDPERRESIIRGAGQLMAETDFHRTPPELGRELHAMIRKVLQNPDPYREIKLQMNTVTKSILPILREKIRCSAHPIETALRFAIAGNVIDFSTFHSISAEDVAKTVEEAANQPIIGLNMTAFEAELCKSETQSLLYICDNCGEIIWDALLIEELRKFVSVTAAVRGSAVVNDATLEDAREAGLPALCRVITTGSDVPGAPEWVVSDEFHEIFLASDFVIAKGQGNLETMQPAKREVLHLFMVKCPVIEKLIHLPKGSLVAMTLPK